MEPASVEPPSRPKRRSTWVAGISLILLGIGGLAAWAIASPGSVSYYATPSELQADADPLKSFRLGGRVADGTLVRSGPVVSFEVTDGEATVPVRFRGEVPNTLQESTDVIAEGTLGPDGTLVATRVLAKCSSKFVPEDKADEHLGRTASG